MTVLWCRAQVVSSINNLIIGKIYVDHGGTMQVTSSASGLTAKLRFKEYSRLRHREPHEVLARNTLRLRLSSPSSTQCWRTALYCCPSPHGSCP